jgi:serine/threonine protein kinase
VTDPAGAASRIGDVLGTKYRILRYLGEGGMSTVYEAQHAVVGRRFAVKFLHADLAGYDEALERFNREARAAGSLNSENIASIVDFGHADDGAPYIVMELLLGEDLAKVLAREGPLPIARAVNLLIQASRGLDAAHAAGIVHRDLKPENLFVCRRGDGSDLLKILDFGIAKLAGVGTEAPPASLTRTGSTMGTPLYMPPEQARGEKDLDHRADIYALGVILYEALAGQRPHPGETYNAILYHVLTQPVAPLQTLRPDVPADLAKVVHQALSPRPSDRPQTVMELARALSRHTGRQVTPLRSQLELQIVPASAGETRASLPAVPGGAPPSPRPPDQAAVSRRPAFTVVALTLVAVAVIALSAIALHARGRGQPSPVEQVQTSHRSSPRISREGAPVEGPSPRPPVNLPASPSASVHVSDPVTVPKGPPQPDPSRRHQRRTSARDERAAVDKRPFFDGTNPYK